MSLNCSTTLYVSTALGKRWLHFSMPGNKLHDISLNSFSSLINSANDVHFFLLTWHIMISVTSIHMIVGFFNFLCSSKIYCLTVHCSWPYSALQLTLQCVTVDLTVRYSWPYSALQLKTIDTLYDILIS